MIAEPLYDGVRKELLDAETLPSSCYTDPAFFNKELKSIFARSWYFAGRVDEVQDAGNYVVVDTPTGSALIIRDNAGELHAWVNACRHRGARLKEGAGRCRTIVCPYHSWRYHLDGELGHAPEMETCGTIFSLEDFPLQPLRIETWGGFIFFSHLDNVEPLQNLAWQYAGNDVKPCAGTGQMCSTVVIRN